MQNWMFLSSFEKLRISLLRQHGFRSLAQIGFNSFPELNSKVVQAVAFVLQNQGAHTSGTFVNLNDSAQSADKNLLFLRKKVEKQYLTLSQDKLRGIPGNPIAYWVSDRIRDVFTSSRILEDVAPVRQGFQTGDNDRFLRQWFEISSHKLGLNFDSTASFHKANKKFAPYNKGGNFRRWFGNNEFVVDFDHESYSFLARMGNMLIVSQHVV